jgi:hypothetical protein
MAFRFVVRKCAMARMKKTAPTMITAYALTSPKPKSAASENPTTRRAPAVTMRKLNVSETCDLHLSQAEVMLTVWKTYSPTKSNVFFNSAKVNFFLGLSFSVKNRKKNAIPAVGRLMTGAKSA